MGNSVKTFYDLEVYKNTYQAAVTICKKIIPQLPKEEKFDLSDQLRRSSKAVPRLIAEAYSKRYQKKGYQSLLDDAAEESNETIVSLSQVKDIYNIEDDLCKELVKLYDITSRQLQNLALAWSNFKERRTITPNSNSNPNKTPTPTPTPTPTRVTAAAIILLLSLVTTAHAATITKTIGPSGCDYTSLDACLDANAQNLTDGAGDIFEAQITGAFEDTTAVTMGDVWTTSATCYVRIYTTAAARHQGVWDENKYHISVGNLTAVTISENYVRVEGLQVVHTPSSAYKSGISISGGWSTCEIRVYQNIVKAVPSTGVGNDYGIVTSDTGLDLTAYIYNNIIYDYKFTGAYGMEGIFACYHGTAYLYNNTVFNCKEGYYAYTSASSGPVVAKNNIANDCTDGFYGTFDGASDYNASDIASDAPGANSRNGTDGAATFKNEGGDDFRLAASDTNARNRGTTNPGSGLYSDDIEGNTRVVPWDIGADEVADTGNAIFFGTNF